jgi:hypothetical protein
MMPLWTTTIRPVQSRCGCAFSSVGRPCVAHRVWPTPYSPSMGSARMTSSRRESFPALRRSEDDLLEAGELPGASTKVDDPLPDHRDAGRVVAAVFKPPQAVNENGDNRLGADIADDSAHGCLFLSGLRLAARGPRPVAGPRATLPSAAGRQSAAAPTFSFRLPAALSAGPPSPPCSPVCRAQSPAPRPGRRR